MIAHPRTTTTEQNPLPPTAPLAAHVSLFQGSTNTTPVETVSLHDGLQRIQTGTYRPYVEQLRHTLATQGKKAYDTAKRRSVAFTPGGIFAKRANAQLTTPSGLLNFDFDHLADLADAKARLRDDPYVVYAFVSPSGEGLKVAVWANGIVDDASYKRAWHAVLAYFEQTYPDLAIANDKGCKDIARLCYVSWDQDLHINHQAHQYAVPQAQEPAPAPTPTAPRTSHQEARVSEYERVEAALRYIPAEGRDTWLTIGMALHASGEPWARHLWDEWSQRSQKYDPRDQARTWASFQPERGVTLGTLFHEAEQYGYRPPTPTPTQDAHRRRNGDPPPPGEPPPARADPPLPYSDYTNALAFVRDHGNDLRYCYPWKSWLVWTGTHWQRDTSGAVMRLAKQTVKRLAQHIEDLDDAHATALMAHIKASLSTQKLKALVECAQSEPGIPVQPEDLDNTPWLLNVANGTLDLTTGTLRPHNRADLLTCGLSIAYEAHAMCPRWHAFLNRILADNQNLITFLQRAIGYALTGVIREHVLLILWGTGRNGKSTFLNILRALLAAYAMKAPSELLMVSNNDRHPTERADLLGKRFVAAIETEHGRRLAEVFVKEATGGDPIRARRMREDFWEFQPTHKVFLATNHKPVITGTDTAIWERIRLVPFTVTIPPDERDTTLPEKLERELPGILAWAVQGCLAWQREGLGEPEEVQQATAGYRTEMDVLGQFIAESCLTGPNYRSKASDLYDAYKRWCEQNGEHSDVQRTWGMALTERGFERKRGTGGAYWWIGVALAQVNQVNDSEPKNGINSSEMPHEGINRKLGSLGSLGSLSVEDAPAEEEGAI